MRNAPRKQHARKQAWKPIALFIALSQSAGIIGSLFTANSVKNWYVTLEQPAITPPSWLFGPVWITLYTLMGYAAFLVWEKARHTTHGKITLTIFFTQLILNALWSILFFGAQNIAAALGEIIVLWFAIVATIILFSRISKTAAWLLVPYLLWVSFATYLNYAFWTLN
jgi:benzodiazapine receptor